MIHKFYEPLVLLEALNQATRDTAISVPPTEPIDREDSKQVFHAFVYKLAHICDNVKGEGGASVTSFTILRKNDDVDSFHYLFACNQKSQDELEVTAEFVRSLLRKVGQSSEGQTQQHIARRDLLRQVLLFNRPRVDCYLGEMRRQLNYCIKLSADLNSPGRFPVPNTESEQY